MISSAATDGRESSPARARVGAFTSAFGHGQWCFFAGDRFGSGLLSAAHSGQVCFFTGAAGFSGDGGAGAAQQHGRGPLKTAVR